MMHLMIANMTVKEDLLKDDKYKYLFSVEEVNRLVLQGIPFRDAYRQVGRQIESGTFTASAQVTHTHEGSMGNLCLPEIQAMMDNVLMGFDFGTIHRALKNLLTE